jgi:hypothetical protein
MAELGALAIRTDTELLLKSLRVVPGLLATAGFEFRHGTWPEAARDLVRRVRGRNEARSLILPAAYQFAQRADDLDVEDRGGLEDRVGVGEQVGGA